MAVTRVAYAADGWGVGELWLDGERLIEHSHPTPEREADGSRRRTAAALVARLRAYFAGERVAFDDIELDLSWCTSFQRDVLATLRRVPYGDVVTYGELAALAGYPGAQRAAGTFCAHNRFALIVPCHRVVGAAGLGGYGSLGRAYKQRLLELERAL